jgi:hypothetical protein
MFNLGLAMQAFFSKLMNARGKCGGVHAAFLGLPKDLSAIGIRAFPKKMPRMSAA